VERGTVCGSVHEPASPEGRETKISTYGLIVLDVGEALVVGGVDAEDGAGGDGGVDVRGAIERVEHHDVVAGVALLHRYWHVLLLRSDHAGAPARLEAVREHLECVVLFLMVVFGYCYERCIEI
jgi:hypothetical protein